MRRVLSILFACAFIATFDGSPPVPAPFTPSDWAITVHHRDRSAWVVPPAMEAGHGADCSAPPATHHVATYADSFFQCHDHIMTAVNGSAGYGAVYFQPPVMADWGADEATIRWDVSTERRSNRDWWDLWVTPFSEQLAAPLDSFLPDLQGPPRRAIHIKMDGRTSFRAYVVDRFQSTELPGRWWVKYEDYLTPSATVRTTFEARISRTHLTFGIPGVVTWIDRDFPAPLDWTAGVVQWGHHSYTPWKDCTTGAPDCGPNTYHWDTISVDPAIPYSIRRVDTGLITTTIPIALPAPIGAHLRFMGYGDALELSFDGGVTWELAQRQAQSKADLGHFATYWHPLPEGATEVRIRSLASCWCGTWAARDIYVMGEYP